jgi:anti-sigma regulatory factor (Ser/Thr protein kinase)
MARRRTPKRVAELLASRRTAEAAEDEARERIARSSDRRALEGAESARRQLESVISQMPAGLLIASESGEVVLGNEQVARIWRQEFEPGAPFGDYSAYRGFRPDGSEYRTEEWPLMRALRNGEVVTDEQIDILRGDGTPATILESARPIRDEDDDDHIVAAVMTFHDVTERRRAERSLRLLAETSELLGAALDLETTIDRITRLVVPELAEVCAVYLVEGEHAARRIAVFAADPAFDELVEDMLRRGPVDAADERSTIAGVIRTGRSVLIPEVRGQALESVAEDAEQVRLLMRLGVASTAIAPLRARGRTLGAMLLGGFREARLLDDTDLPLIEDIAQRAALAVDNARLYRAEVATVELLQRSLLPEQLPQLTGAEVTGRYVAAGAGERVGGDWYDVIPLTSGTTGLVIGDVAGHGVRAAAVMGRMRNALRAFALDGDPPARVLERLNAFERRVGDGEMATLLYGVFDPERHELRFASAGHPWPLVVSPDGEVVRLGGGRSVPIGVRSRPRFEEAVERLGPGAVLLLYTDGLVERRGEPLDTGIERIESAAAGPAAGLEELCERVLAAASEAGKPEDDVALLAFRPLARTGQRLELWLPAEPESLAVVRRRLRHWLGETPATPDETADIVLACGEACANAVEHAYGPGDATMHVEGALGPRGIDLTVADAGSWRTARGEDRGLGLRLMESLMDEVSIDAGDAGTQVKMRRRLAGDGSA